MDKTLFGLALLSYNWDHNKKDIIDSYIPLVCNSIMTKGHSKVTRELTKSDLIEFYGIDIPLGAIESILKRMVKDNLLKRQAGEFLVDNKKVCESVKSSQKVELDTAFNSLVIDINKYSLEVFETELSTEEIETGLITFFKENDLDILFANNNGDSVLPKVKVSKKAKYIIAKFITDLQTKDPAKFALVLKLAKGYSIASLITYKDLQHYSGSLNNVEIFLDAPVIFNLLGLNGESNFKLSQELIDLLKTNGSKLRIFEINYIEVIKTVQDAINRLNSKNYDIAKSSRILKTAVRENISAQQLQIKLNQLDSMLVTSLITKVPSPTLAPEEYKFQIDEKKLQEIIEDLYKKNESYKIPWYKANQIERDVESISNIFKIRKRIQATNLKTSKAILLTSNEFIAYAAKKFEKYEWEYKSAIPVCVTDIFLSTILWANYPTQNDNLNIKILISECYNIIELDNRLLSRFYEDIKKMNKENIITDEQFYLLSASNLTYTLLEQKTLNDLDEYTDKTPTEILEDLQLRINAELDIEKAKVSRIEINISKIAVFFAKSIFILIALLLIFLSILLKIISPPLNNNLFNCIAVSLSAIVGIFGLLRWVELIPTKLKIESSIEKRIFKILNKVLNKE